MEFELAAVAASLFAHFTAIATSLVGADMFGMDEEMIIAVLLSSIVDIILNEWLDNSLFRADYLSYFFF